MNVVPIRQAESTFADFWKAYPRKVAKKAALKAWTRALREGATPEAILDALARWRRSGQFPTDMQYVPHPTTWLNQGRWEDEYDEALPSGRVTAADIEARMQKHETR